jgi:hypothetical protein
VTVRAAVLTAITDDYDTLKPVMPQDGADVDWVCFTDSVQLRDEAARRPVIRPESNYVDSVLVHPTGWEIVWVPRPADGHPNRVAKTPKVLPGFFTDAPASVWLDASFRVVSPTFVRDVVDHATASPSGVAQFKHPWRSCTYDEAEESIRLPKYRDEAATIDLQALHMLKEGMPRGWGLWATGVIARLHTRKILDWGTDWGTEIGRYSYQDQISHPFTCWRHGIRPADLPGTHLANRWLQYEGSARHG